MRIKRNMIFAITSGFFLTTIASPSHATALILTFHPIPALAGLLSIAAAPHIRNPFTRRWTVIVDPVDVQSFQLELSYDPTRMQYAGIEYIDPYVQLGEGLNLSMPGLISNIAGQVFDVPPPPGEVDIFALEFDDLAPSSNDPSYFTVFASRNDYITGLDTDTGMYLTATAADISPVTTSTIPVTTSTIPEPSSMAMLLAGLIFAGTARLRRKAAAL